MDPYNRIPVPPDLRPLSLADLVPPQDPHNFIPPERIIDPPEVALERAFARHYSPVYSIVRTPPDSPHDDSAEVQAAIINAIVARGGLLPEPWAQLANANPPNPTGEANAPPPANYPVIEPQELAQPIRPPLDDEGLSRSTVSGLPLSPFRSPPGFGLSAESTAAPYRAWSHAHPPFSSSALGLQPAPPTSLGNNNIPNVPPLHPHVQPQYPRLSEREAAAVEREAAALRTSHSHGHTSQLDQPQQRSAWANNQALAQVGQPPHPGQSFPSISHSQPGINTSSTLPTSPIHMDATTTSLEPAGVSSPSPESDPSATPPTLSTTASNLTSRNPSRQVTGESSSTEVPIPIDPIAGRKRTAEQAFAGNGAPNSSSSGSEEDEDMVDQLMEESEPQIGAEAEAEAGGGEHNNPPVFIIEDGQRPSPKRRKLYDTSNAHNANRGINIRLPPPPSLAGSSRPPAAPTPGMMFSQLDIDPATTAFAAPIDTTLASANLPPPVPMFQRDPDAPPSYADWVCNNQPDVEVERWMECTRRNLAYDPSVVPAPPEGFESGKNRRKGGNSGEDTSGEKDVGHEGEREASLQGEEGNTTGGAGGSRKRKPYEINEDTPPNINEGLWCLFDYPQTVKPKYSYAFMARVAILGSPTRRLQLQDIYVMIEAKFPHYRDGNHGSWRVRFAVFLLIQAWWIDVHAWNGVELDST
jgi:hypothetical protein